MKFYLLCGLPFSGKSTFAKILMQRTGAVVIRLDDLVIKAGHDLSEQLPVSVWEQAHQDAFELIKEHAKVGEDIVLDDTNFLKKLRERFTDVAKEVGYDVQLVYVQTPLEILEERRTAVNPDERNNLSDEAFYPVVNGFEVPLVEEEAYIINGTRDFEEQLEIFLK